MSKLNQVSNPSIYPANQSENTIKNNHIKKTNQSNLSFWDKFKNSLKKEIPAVTQSNTQYQATQFLNETFEIPKIAEMETKDSAVVYQWNETLEPYLPNSADQRVETHNPRDADKLPEQFLKDFNRINYTMTCLGLEMPEFSNQFTQEERLRFLIEFVTFPHAEKLCQIAHQGHLAEPYITLTMKNKNYDYIIPQSKENDKLTINIEKTEDNNYIITSRNEYYLKQIQPEKILENTVLFTERKSYLVSHNNGELTQDPNKNDLLTIKITQKYN